MKEICIGLKPGQRLTVEVEEPTPSLLPKEQQDPRRQAFQHLTDWFVKHAPHTLPLAQKGRDQEVDLYPDEELTRVVEELRTQGVSVSDVQNIFKELLTQTPSSPFNSDSLVVQSVAGRITDFLHSIETWEREES